MSKLTFLYNKIEGPFLAVLLKRKQYSTLVVALVDSGADYSKFPKRWAYDLGLTEADLTLAKEESIVGDGRRVPTWTVGEPITGRIYKDLNLYGPEIMLSCEFGDDVFPVFGRLDFFTAFSAVTFEQGPNRCCLQLAYD